MIFLKKIDKRKTLYLILDTEITEEGFNHPIKASPKNEKKHINFLNNLKNA